jgi:hypothetical protein
MIQHVSTLYSSSPSGTKPLRPVHPNSKCSSSADDASKHEMPASIDYSEDKTRGRNKIRDQQEPTIRSTKGLDNAVVSAQLRM